MRGIFLGLGSNKGDREAFIARATEMLEASNISVLKASSLYENPAMLPEGAPADWDQPFLNQIIQVDTDLAPHSLLTIAKVIEKRLGRLPGQHWAPREIDIDIIAYHDLCFDSDDITLPHIGLLKRDFVLVPFAEIAPQWAYPRQGEYFKKTAYELMKRLPVLKTTLYREASQSVAS